MKRTFAFMMALVLVLSLSVSAFAAGGDNGTITISNAAVGSTFSVYKIFDATYNEQGDVTYTITSANPFFTVMFGAEGKAPNDYFVYHAETGVVTRTTNEEGKYVKSDAELFAYLQNLVKDADTTITATKTEDNEIKFTNLATGYYVIKSEMPGENGQKTVAVTITTAKPDAVVNDKNNLPGGDFEKKFTDGTDAGTANVGDVVSWKLTFTATNYSKEEKVVLYTIKDNLNPAGWAAIDLNSLTIKVGKKTLVKDTDWELDPSSTANGFVIRIPWVDTNKEFIYAPTVPVEVTYNATVLEKASENPNANKNEAKLEWTLDTGETPPGSGDETETEVFNLGFTKVDGTSGEGLIGAEFTLTDANGNAINVTGENGVYVVNPDPKGSNLVITPASGKVVIQGLAAGTYKLTETKAPDGYNKLDTPVTVIVGETQKNADGTDKVDSEGNKIYVTSGMDMNDDNVNDYIVSHEELDIANFTGVELPSTGGEGTMMMITIGTMVAMAFAVLMITQKKMSIYQD